MKDTKLKEDWKTPSLKVTACDQCLNWSEKKFRSSDSCASERGWAGSIDENKEVPSNEHFRVSGKIGEHGKILYWGCGESKCAGGMGLCGGK